MTQAGHIRKVNSQARVLVISMAFAPCKEVGGKRFAYLSRYLSRWCRDYQVLARREKPESHDPSVYCGIVHRVRAYPHYSPTKQTDNIFRKVMLRAYFKWFSPIDPDAGWIIPAIVKGIRLCKKETLNVVIVTVPSFSAMVAASVVSKFSNARLIIDYRDPWTNHLTEFPGPCGKWLCPAIERWAIAQASAVVVCTDIMSVEFNKAFGSIAPSRVEVIYNAFEPFEAQPGTTPNESQTTMLFAGVFYGTRRLSMIAPVLAELLEAGDISQQTFRFHLYAQLNDADYDLVDELGIRELIEVHDPVPHNMIMEVMCKTDILFLPSGSDVAYAVPYKFFDYLSARRPILAVAPKQSSIDHLMRTVDCGEFAEFGNGKDIRRALTTMLQKTKTYSFTGADRFSWESAARKYVSVIDHVASSPTERAMATDSASR